MSEKPSGKARHPPPPISLFTRLPGRSRSVSNGLEREPKSQPVRFLERRSSITSDSSNNDKRRVSQLIDYFEKPQSTDDLHQLQGTLSTNQTSSNDGKIGLLALPSCSFDY